MNAGSADRGSAEDTRDRGHDHAGFFAIASRDEVWISGALVETTLMYGQARLRGSRIDASDLGEPHLIRTCEDSMAAARDLVTALGDSRIRIVTRATREDETTFEETTITIRRDGRSVVTTPSDALADYELLTIAPRNQNGAGVAGWPILWQNGSAAVLLHEAIGHASEESARPVAWPEWLLVDAPLQSRRETFRDVPLPRMKHLIARQDRAPFDLPAERIEVQLLAGGSFDPITDVVTIHVAASTAGAFTIRCTRAQIAAAVCGARGEPLRYPGVICSREGQRLYVQSHAPEMITSGLS